MIDEKGKDLLRHIDDYLTNSSTADADDLWNILSALRGPDKPSEMSFKSYTTGVLRLAVLPHASRMGRTGEIYRDDKFSLEMRKKMIDSEYQENHFYSHITRAFQAAGLEWYKVNE